MASTFSPLPLSIVLLAVTAASAQPAPPATRPGDGGASLMARLGEETRAAYGAVRPCLVGVELPLPPEVSGASAGEGKGDARTLIVAAQAMGVRLDAEGHVLLPVAVDPASVPTGELRAWSADGAAGEAAFVGVDPKTQLTLLRLKPGLADRVATAGACDGEPEAGSLVILLSGLADSGRLLVWGGGRREKGLIVDGAGRVAGFARGGQFVCLAEVGPILDALRRSGRVERPTFGMELSEVRPDFPRTAHADAPPDRPSLRVETVAPGGPAERAGVRPGDYLLAVAGKPVPDMTALAIALAGRTGDAELALHRDGRPLTVTVTLPVP